jgi:hypothetical protein
MSDRVLRGTRLGAVSYESDRHTEFAPRQRTAYDCPAGHATAVPFAAEAEIPSSVGVPRLRSHRAAARRHPARGEEGQAGPHPLGHAARAPSTAELEEVLAERLAVLHEHQGKVKAALKSERAKDKKSA